MTTTQQNQRLELSVQALPCAPEDPHLSALSPSGTGQGPGAAGVWVSCSRFLCMSQHPCEARTASFRPHSLTDFPT